MAYKFKDSITGEVIVIESSTQQAAINEASEMSPFFEIVEG